MDTNSLVNKRSNLRADQAILAKPTKVFHHTVILLSIGKCLGLGERGNEFISANPNVKLSTYLKGSVQLALAFRVVAIPTPPVEPPP